MTESSKNQHSELCQALVPGRLAGEVEPEEKQKGHWDRGRKAKCMEVENNQRD